MPMRLLCLLALAVLPALAQAQPLAVGRCTCCLRVGDDPPADRVESRAGGAAGRWIGLRWGQRRLQRCRLQPIRFGLFRWGRWRGRMSRCWRMPRRRRRRWLWHLSVDPGPQAPARLPRVPRADTGGSRAGRRAGGIGGRDGGAGGSSHSRCGADRPRGERRPVWRGTRLFNPPARHPGVGRSRRSSGGLRRPSALGKRGDSR